mmetsp:Transcript_3001/g.8440  ORF Transcript_3001/g.8440 Transcript_3001/m.8440 type:complete len:794 (+) Transcript_3001:167-2548(+)
MGNSASALPYSIDNQVGAPHDHSGWALHEGKSTADGSLVSVFVAKKPMLVKTPVSPRFPQKMQLVPAFHHFQNCRKFRHPQILKVMATLDTDNPNAANGEGSSASSSNAAMPSATTGDLIIVTEPCVPLEQWLLSNPSPDELAWGLECIVRGMHFMHASAKMAHGNMSPSSFYVTQAGDVKVWNFSLVTAIGTNLGPTPQFQEWESAICPDAYRSPERVEGRWDAISSAGVHCMDSYGLGILIDHFFSGSIPSKLQKAVQRLQTGNIKMRPRLQPLLKCPVFDTSLQKIHLQLEEITIQPVEQKISMWQALANQLQSGALPSGLAKSKLLPLLKTSISTICSNEAMLSQDLYRREVLAMLQPFFSILENFLDSGDIGKELTPIAGMLFSVKDRGVRGALLGKVSLMAQHLDKNTLNQAVFEPLCSGFSDSSSALRELTLKATAELVSYLNQPNLEKLSRYLVRLQGDTETSIRTNAVIFIGRLAPSLTEISREKLLLPAYARAFKDVFIPCRKAALQGILKTRDFFNVSALANKVLPAIMPMLLDPVTEIRNDAFQVVESFMGKLREESMRMATLAQQEQRRQLQMSGAQASAAAVPNSAPATAPVPSTPGAVTPAPVSGGYLSGISSWMSSSTTPSSTAPSASQTAPAAASPAVAPAPATAPIGIASTQQQFSAMSMNTNAATALGGVADDGWDDADEDHWSDADDGGVPAVAAATPSMAAANTSFGFGATDNDDPFAAIGATPSRSVAPRSGGSKLVVPKKKATPVAVKLAAPATKLAMDDDEIADGWDDF